eukprot:364323-Chlamydomonas_euryale.AAC.5
MAALRACSLGRSALLAQGSPAVRTVSALSTAAASAAAAAASAVAPAVAPSAAAAAGGGSAMDARWLQRQRIQAVAAAAAAPPVTLPPPLRRHAAPARRLRGSGGAASARHRAWRRGGHARVTARGERQAAGHGKERRAGRAGGQRAPDAFCCTRRRCCSGAHGAALAENCAQSPTAGAATKGKGTGAAEAVPTCPPPPAWVQSSNAGGANLGSGATVAADRAWGVRCATTRRAAAAPRTWRNTHPLLVGMPRMSPVELVPNVAPRRLARGRARRVPAARAASALAPPAPPPSPPEGLQKPRWASCCARRPRQARAASRRFPTASKSHEAALPDARECLARTGCCGAGGPRGSVSMGAAAQLCQRRQPVTGRVLIRGRAAGEAARS